MHSVHLAQPIVPQDTSQTIQWKTDVMIYDATKLGEKRGDFLLNL